MPEHSTLRNWLKTRIREGGDEHSHRVLLDEFEQFFRYVFNGSVDGISILDLQYTILEVNDTMRRWYAHKGPLNGQLCYRAYHDASTPCPDCPTQRAVETGRPQIGIVPYDGPDHIVGRQQLSVFPLFDDAGNIFGLIEYVRDVTTLKTEELAVENLKKRIQFQHQTLQEQEVALRVLRKQGEADARRALNTVSEHVNTLILPLLRRIQDQVEDVALSDELETLERRLCDVLSPFCSRIARDTNLSPREIEIAELIRSGRTTQQIASSLGISAKGVDFHRMNIRKKLGLVNSSEHLRPFLLRRWDH